MINDVARSLLLCEIIGTVLVFSMKYIISSFVLPGMNVTDSLYSTERYDSYIAEKVAKN